MAADVRLDETSLDAKVEQRFLSWKDIRPGYGLMRFFGFIHRENYLERREDDISLIDMFYIGSIMLADAATYSVLVEGIKYLSK
jgi:hypothetical protein